MGEFADGSPLIETAEGEIVSGVGPSLKVVDAIDSGNGVQGSISVGTSAVEAKVGATRLSGRRFLSIQPQDQNIYWGFTSSVTTSTGTLLFKNGTAYFEITDEQAVYLIADSGGKSARVTEA